MLKVVHDESESNATGAAAASWSMLNAMTDVDPQPMLDLLARVDTSNVCAASHSCAYPANFIGRAPGQPRSPGDVSAHESEMALGVDTLVERLRMPAPMRVLVDASPGGRSRAARP